MLSKLQGAIIGFCIEYDYKFEIMPPTAWRKCLEFNQGKTVKRNSLKCQAQDYAVSRCGKKLSQDQADAVCIGYAFYKKEAGKGV